MAYKHYDLMVETGESRTLPETRATDFYDFIREAVNVGQQVAMPVDDWLTEVSLQSDFGCPVL